MVETTHVAQKIHGGVLSVGSSLFSAAEQTVFFLEFMQFSTFLISTAYRFKLMKLEAGFWHLCGLFSELLHKRRKVTEKVVCQKGELFLGIPL